jgi:peroxiredoxin (alkyl hydroperoxide reductase subunit C)
MRHFYPYLLLPFLCLPSFALNAQDRNPVPMIGDVAPAFTAQSTKGVIQFPDDYFGKWKIIFSHPADFTAVCTSEIFELALMQDEFQ